MAQEEVDTLALDVLEMDEIAARPREYSLFSARVTGTVPHPVRNSAFKKTFIGIYELNAGLNLTFYKGFYAGAVFKNNLLKINSKRIPNYNAGMVMNSAAVKVGGDFYVNEKNTCMFAVAVAVGQNSTRYTSLVAKNPANPPAITEFKSLYIEPEAGIYLFIEPNIALGIVANYSIIQRPFDPYELALNDWLGYGKTNTGAIQYISFGFGVYYGFSTR